ncbi:MAG: hypothetical protein D6797_07745 [Bdellovibrio sp.]|nr:MAG: hypothetical protein D6797_07745 [Bdellovibrio sp.]
MKKAGSPSFSESMEDSLKVKALYYEILDLRPDASKEQIILAYENAKKLYAPSNKEIYKFFSQEELQELFELIEVAFHTLKDPERRRKYDISMGLIQKKDTPSPSVEEPKNISGQSLKAFRQKKGLSLDDISEATCIKKKYLIAIEEENFQALPAPVFVRGYIKHIAQYLGFQSPQNVVSSFMQKMKNA